MIKISMIIHIYIHFTYDDKFCFSSSLFVPYSSSHFNSLETKSVSDKIESLNIKATPNASRKLTSAAI